MGKLLNISLLIRKESSISPKLILQLFNLQRKVCTKSIYPRVR